MGFHTDEKKKWAEIKTQIVYLKYEERDFKRFSNNLLVFIGLCLEMLWLLCKRRWRIRTRREKKTHSSVSDVLFRLQFVFRSVYIHRIKKLCILPIAKCKRQKYSAFLDEFHPHLKQICTTLYSSLRALPFFFRSLSHSRSHNQYALRYS